MNKKEILEEVKKKILKNRRKIEYCLCYGLKQDLTEKEIEDFKKIFIKIYEEELLENIGLKTKEGEKWEHINK